MDLSGELESKALELIALNIAFESARSGPSKDKLLELALELAEKSSRRSERGSSGSV